MFYIQSCNFLKDKIEKYVTLLNETSSGRHKSYLTIKEITWEEIGNYSCHYEQGLDIPNLTKNNSIYVFVTGSF